MADSANTSRGRAGLTSRMPWARPCDPTVARPGEDHASLCPAAPPTGHKSIVPVSKRKADAFQAHPPEAPEDRVNPRPSQIADAQPGTYQLAVDPQKEGFGLV